MSLTRGDARLVARSGAGSGSDRTASAFTLRTVLGMQREPSLQPACANKWLLAHDGEPSFEPTELAVRARRRQRPPRLFHCRQGPGSGPKCHRQHGIRCHLDCGAPSHARRRQHLQNGRTMPQRLWPAGIRAGRPETPDNASGRLQPHRWACHRPKPGAPQYQSGRHCFQVRRDRQRAVAPGARAIRAFKERPQWQPPCHRAKRGPVHGPGERLQQESVERLPRPALTGDDSSPRRLRPQPAQAQLVKNRPRVAPPRRSQSARRRER